MSAFNYIYPLQQLASGSPAVYLGIRENGHYITDISQIFMDKPEGANSTNIYLTRDANGNAVWVSEDTLFAKLVDRMFSILSSSDGSITITKQNGKINLAGQIAPTRALDHLTVLSNSTIDTDDLFYGNNTSKNVAKITLGSIKAHYTDDSAYEVSPTSVELSFTGNNVISYVINNGKITITTVGTGEVHNLKIVYTYTEGGVTKTIDDVIKLNSSTINELTVQQAIIIRVAWNSTANVNVTQGTALNQIDWGTLKLIWNDGRANTSASIYVNGSLNSNILAMYYKVGSSNVTFNNTNTVGNYGIYVTYNGIPTTTSKSITVTEPVQQSDYYWYVGTDDPSLMTTNSPTATGNDTGWRHIGTTLPTYSKNNMLWNGDENNINVSRNYIYLALPSSSLGLYNILEGNEIGTSYTAQGTCQVNNVTYYIYKSNAKLFTFAFNIY